MTIDINKRMLEQHSQALKQQESDRAILITAVIYSLTVIMTLILLGPL